MYKKIKEILLNDKNINEVKYITREKKIEVKPVQNKSFLSGIDVFENFEKGLENEIFIGDKCFKVFKMDNFNTQVYSITLKEI